ncbi:1-deoxyxylulose-5-phosphate synthase YajO-like isoform X2 [Littorina saxatilis]|uniref:1-deoxyxylulose-5-phosphate synthase YajO-like isoform X2 n=1 Tax=Littorina saxatilis TaxID=31220 RepID=UPI0038B5259A
MRKPWTLSACSYVLLRHLHTDRAYTFAKMADIPEEKKCSMNFLGRSGLRVSNICLGAMTFGEHNLGTPGQLDEAGSHAVINRFVEWGGNFIDTANIYGRGKSETIVGNWLTSQERDRFVIATKARIHMDVSNPNDVGLSRRHLTKSIEDSLRRLQTDYVDLLQIHMWDSGTPLEETLMTLNDLVRSGKVRYLGASNLTGWQLQKIVDLSKELNLIPFISLQQQYSVLERSSELEPFQVCKLNGVGVLPFSPLKAGFLTGKFQKGQRPTEGRLAFCAEDPDKKMPNSHPQWSKLDTERNWAILDALREIAEARGKTMAQVSIRWLLQKPVVSSVIIGANKLNQLDDNMGAANGWTLTEEEMMKLDTVSKPDVPYPYDIVWRMNTSRQNPWNPSGLV